MNTTLHLSTRLKTTIRHPTAIKISMNTTLHLSTRLKTTIRHPTAIKISMNATLHLSNKNQNNNSTLQSNQDINEHHSTSLNKKQNTIRRSTAIKISMNTTTLHLSTRLKTTHPTTAYKILMMSSVDNLKVVVEERCQEIVVLILFERCRCV